MDFNLDSRIGQFIVGATMGIIATPSIASASEAVQTLPEIIEQEAEMHVCKCMHRTPRTVRLVQSPKTKRLLG